MTDRQAVLSAWATDAGYRTVDESRMLEVLMLAGWAAELHAGTTDGIRSQAGGLLDSYVARGLPFGTADGHRTFDPVEVFGFSKCLGFNGEDPFWIDRCVRADRERFCRLGAVPLPAEVTVDLRRTFNVTHASDIRPARLRLPLSIEGGGRVEVMDDGGLFWRTDASGQRLEAKAVSPSRVATAVRYAFTVGMAEKDGKDDLDLYLAPSEGYVQVTPAVAALASRLGSDMADRAAKVSRFWDYMLDEMVSCPVHHDRALRSGCATDWVLTHRRFDCHLGSAFLVALCRAAGIPARIVTGYLLRPDFSTSHAWVEIWLDAWRPFDLMAWDLSAGGRDAAWRRALAGQLEPRMTTQRLPLHFTGPVGVPWPARWHLLQRHAGTAVEVLFVDVDTGALVYKDEVRIAFPQRP